MVDVDKLSDAEIRTKLLEFGFPVMPITGTTRKVMVKKLKLLLENKDRKVGSSEGRRSLGRYSSEEESDNEAKRIKKDKNRRATMAAPISQAPKTAKKIVEPEVASSSPNRQIRNATVTTTTRTQRIVRTSQDEFDTGSDSESDIVASSRYDSAIDGDYKRSSPVKSTLSNLSDRPYSSPKSDDTLYTTVRNIYSSQTSPARHTSFGSPSLASEYAADKLNQMRNRLSLGSPGYERPSYSSLATANDQDDKAETPFLSNFTRRLSALSSSRNADLNNRNDLVKEHDTNGSSPYGPKAYLSSFRSTRREPLYDYKNGHLSGKSNFVSFAVLAGAALFFIFLAVIYLGMRSDTAIVTSGYITPACHLGDPQSKKGVNCVHEDDVKNVLNLLNVLRPELLKRAVAHRCFDPKIKPHMTEAEIVTYCQTNFGIKDAYMIKNDLRNLEIMIFFNPEWGVSVVQTESNDGGVFEENAAKNMEQVVFNNDSKITSLVIFKPDLPWRCSMYQTLSSLVKTVAAVGAIFAVLYFGDLGFKYYRRHEQRQKDEVNFLVERIIEILQNASEEPGDNFVVINHVRDMILTVKDRKEKRGSWAKAVKYINENESRIRTEVQSVQGESFEVWRWIGSASLNRSGSPGSGNKSWQGQAFETQVGSVNSLNCSPTPCLKIRGMFSDGEVANAKSAREAVLSKCAHRCRILHCQAEPSSGCVYLKAADTQDAAVAYRNLHGWWYAGHLVTVKYLRLERYMQRFPNSPSAPPYLKASSPSLD
ncbi:inner nuclear membrane protein Man1-like isoform X2 [Cylas formicarius]|uniref:inner nuclear membrane protein Man1-like isoform X2 n=1 Tax=Cylas formicarius TaxID=197179 RepID=UPI002958B2CC|nr:inner nuclear membrane protein Man1-like isoform X2 [Cylas formicarius]